MATADVSIQPAAEVPEGDDQYWDDIAESFRSYLHDAITANNGLDLDGITAVFSKFGRETLRYSMDQARRARECFMNDHDRRIQELERRVQIAEFRIEPVSLPPVCGDHPAPCNHDEPHKVTS